MMKQWKIWKILRAFLKLKSVSNNARKNPDLTTTETIQGDLEYNLQYESDQETNQMKGRKPHQTEQSTGQNWNDFAVSIVDHAQMAQELAENLNGHMSQDSVQFGADQLFLKLVRSMRSLNKQQIKQVLGPYANLNILPNVNQETKPKITEPKLLQPMAEMTPQILVSCGTRDCVQVLVDFVKLNPGKRLKAALALIPMINTKIISPEIIQDLKVWVIYRIYF